MIHRAKILKKFLVTNVLLKYLLLNRLLPIKFGSGDGSLTHSVGVLSSSTFFFVPFVAMLSLGMYRAKDQTLMGGGNKINGGSKRDF